DVLMGVGGASEGLITAAAVKALGGGMQGMRAPQREDEKRRLKEDHVKIREVLTLDKLIRSDNTIWAATGITQGTFLEGVDFGQETGIITHSIAIRALTGSIRFIKSIHQLDPQPSGGPADATPAQVAFEVVE
ncbi:MAG: fructose-bisphosphatase class II, partial [Phaeodactylibacter sp.]|nr:fructose-bisphosphatase class II [Phaeodactylibacter sp.]